jgi:hypothetical protein
MSDPREIVKLENAAKAVFNSFMTWRSEEVIREVAEPPKFRGSGVPHCPIKWAYAHTSKQPRMDERSFMLEYTAEQGKVVHALVQKWLGIMGIMFGKWKCTKCNTIHPKGEAKGLLGPVTCCGIPCEYEEFDMKAPRLQNFSGHCDGVIKIMNKYAPLEMKVRGATEMATIAKAMKPVYKNLLQGTSYRYVLPSMLSPTISRQEWHDFVVLAYFDRADIRNKIILFAPYEPKIFEKEVLAVKHTREAIQTGNFHLLDGYCKSPNDDRFCDLHDLCFSKDPISSLDKILP